MIAGPRRWLAAVALIVVAALLASCQPGVRMVAPGDPVSDPSEALRPFFQALGAVESGARDEPVVIVQLGDSHTAGDRFSGTLRSLFQQRFGDGGRGYLAPGVPFDYYRPSGVEANQSDGWQAVNSLRGGVGGLFGLTGYRVTTDEAGERMTLADQGGGFDHAAVTLLGQPGGGAVEIAIDGRVVADLDTDRAAVQATRVDLPVAGLGRQLTVTTLEDDAPVTMLGWSLERRRAGVALDAHGVVGATVSVIDNWQLETVRWELAERDPDLVILAFGTNEAFDDDLEPATYRRQFADQLRFIGRAVPNAAILVVGPPDANRRSSACPRGEEAEDDPIAQMCAPLNATEIASYSALFGDDASGEACRWHPPPNLERVRAVQRQVAAAEGAYFWDWSQVMGGACGTNRWATADPPLAFGDRVHLRDAGYRRSAEMLYRELMAQFRGWQAGQSLVELPPSP